jgi:hypothetical protein
VPDVADGEETDDEDDEDEVDDEDEDPLAGVAALELAAPAAAAPRCAEAGRATAIAAAVAALSTPAPTVTAASLVLPRRRFRWAVASSAFSDSCSVAMVASRFSRRSVRSSFSLAALDQWAVPEGWATPMRFRHGQTGSRSTEETVKVPVTSPGLQTTS